VLQNIRECQLHMHISGVTNFAHDVKPGLRLFFSLTADLQLVNVVLLLSVPCFYISGCLSDIGVICNLFVPRQ
jgi:hypothetical protein